MLKLTFSVEERKFVLKENVISSLFYLWKYQRTHTSCSRHGRFQTAARHASPQHSKHARQSKHPKCLPTADSLFQNKSSRYLKLAIRGGFCSKSPPYDRNVELSILTQTGYCSMLAAVIAPMGSCACSNLIRIRRLTA